MCCASPAAGWEFWVSESFPASSVLERRARSERPHVGGVMFPHWCLFLRSS